ncbi:MAG: DUF1648 domain-containing protein [Ruminococcaceae bacterium]|nr:DUF1648 domain-containing protein [Oscillospiraceae bacterium]
MKYIKWKSLCITGLVCLSPILLGIALWDTLPDTIAIHFNMYNEPDNFASKEFAVFGLPLMMLVPQIISCMINDFNTHKHGERKKFTLVTKWIIPIMSVILQVVTLGYSLGWNLDIRKVTALMVSIIFLVIGNYLPKFDYIKNYNIDAEKAKKINRFIGFETVIMGILGLITIFMPPVTTVIWLFLLIPYAIIAVLYGLKIGYLKDKK